MLGSVEGELYYPYEGPSAPMWVSLLIFVVGIILLAGCSTPIKTTLDTAQSECDQVKATIKNIDGLESVTIRCTWEDDVEVW